MQGKFQLQISANIQTRALFLDEEQSYIFMRAAVYCINSKWSDIYHILAHKNYAIGKSKIKEIMIDL